VPCLRAAEAICGIMMRHGSESRASRKDSPRSRETALQSVGSPRVGRKTIEPAAPKNRGEHKTSTVRCQLSEAEENRPSSSDATRWSGFVNTAIVTDHREHARRHSDRNPVLAASQRKTVLISAFDSHATSSLSRRGGRQSLSLQTCIELRFETCECAQ